MTLRLGLGLYFAITLIPHLCDIYFTSLLKNQLNDISDKNS